MLDIQPSEGPHMAVESPNCLYFGDCLDVMREDIPAASVDLIYLDPPFNSKRLYNAFIGGAQWVAFDDTWRWHEAIDDFHEVAGRPNLAGVMEGLRLILGEGPQLAYLSYMANRLLECHRVLKETGSIYLHCDPTMSHYLKAVMDGIFRGQHFRNEISWKRTTTKGDYRQGATNWPRVRDVILHYSRAVSKARYCQQFIPYSEGYLNRSYRYNEGGRRYRLDNLAAPGRGTRGHPKYEFMGVTRFWRYNEAKMQRLLQEGRIVQTAPGRVPAYKRYLDEMPGVALGDRWDDISPVQGSARERTGYPTQKPLALLERIIKASSNEGDIILDPFCGCGTAIHAAQNLNRQWIGIDICVNACKVIERRLKGHFDSLWSEIEFRGLPKTRDDARFMAGSDPFRFERWAASLVDGMEANKKQHGDHGIDGWGRIPIRKGQFVDMVSQLKGGHTNPGHVQAFNGARQQAKADLGIFTYVEDRVTNGMRDAAVNTGKFISAQVVQRYTVEDCFEGRKPALSVAA